jgi:phage terminase large subunit-like protein
MERVFKDRVPYDVWEEEGYLTVTNSPIVDQNQMIEYFEKEIKENNWKVQTLCFDPANASKLMLDLAENGYECVEVYQSHKSLNESTAGFREQVFEGNVYYEYNPLLNFAMANTVVRQNNGLIKIDKDATAKKIDPIDAILGAFKLALYHEFAFDASKYISEEYLNKLYGSE